MCCIMLAREAYVMIQIKATILSPHGVFSIDNNAFCYSSSQVYILIYYYTRVVSVNVYTIHNNKKYQNIVSILFTLQYNEYNRVLYLFMYILFYFLLIVSIFGRITNSSKKFVREISGIKKI